MGFEDLVNRTSSSFRTVFGQALPLFLHGVSDGTVQAIYDAGGEVVDPATSEMVMVRPSIVVSLADSQRITYEHTLRTPDGDLKIFGAPVPDGSGDVIIQLVMR